MKKAWQKPLLIAEKFDLSQPYALGCEVKPDDVVQNGTNYFDCDGDGGHSWTFTDYIFTDNEHGCNYHINTLDELIAYGNDASHFVNVDNNSKSCWGSAQHRPAINHEAVFNS